MPKRKKNFVLDTSVLVYHEDAIHAFPENNVWITMEVLEELDKLKTRKDSVGNAARYVNRFLDRLRDKGSLSKGVLLENGQKIFVLIEDYKNFKPEQMAEINDNKIISGAIYLKEIGKKNVVLISRDIAMRVKCDSLGIKSENYSKNKANIKRNSKAFTGVSVIEVHHIELEEFYKEGELEIIDELMPNEFVVLKSHQKQSALGIYKDGLVKKLSYAGKKDFGIEGISPRSKEQAFAMEMLLDENIHMATITGQAGSGKTLLACATALNMLFSGKYEKIIISRPVVSMSKDIGFLPGSKEEKMQSWVQPFFDNFKAIFKDSNTYMSNFFTSGAIEVEALTYIRGRSLPNTIFILDESQNITYHEAKAVLTRMGENSKIIMLGDLEQIDAPHLDSSLCGLSSVVELFKEFEHSAHIKLLKGERSKLATYAAKVL